MALPLSVPTPALFLANGAPVTAGQKLADTKEPLIVKLSALRRGMTPIGITDLKAFTLHLLRKESEEWVRLDDVPLEYKPDDPAAPWQGQVILMGAPDKFTEGPQYAVRAAFTLRDGTEATSERSPAFLLPPPPAENMKAGVKIKPDTEVPTSLEIYLKDGSGTTAGKLVIEQSGTITITNHQGLSVVMDGATLTLSAAGAQVELKNGNISLTPAEPDGWIILNKRTRIDGIWQHPAL